MEEKVVKIYLVIILMALFAFVELNAVDNNCFEESFLNLYFNEVIKSVNTGDLYL